MHDDKLNFSSYSKIKLRYFYIQERIDKCV